VSWLAAALTISYACILGVLWIGLVRMAARSRSGSRDRKSVESPPAVSVVVAARNEEGNLPTLLSHLFDQDYPADKRETIVVDDRSEDASWSILQDARRQHPQLVTLRIDDLQPGYAPKKRALDLGIRHAHGEIILLTDADCSPPPTWVSTMVELHEEDVVAVAGYSPYEFRSRTPGLVRGMFSLDALSFAAVAAGSAWWGQPLTASGTNLSYRKDAYRTAGGFETVKEWLAGDDDLMMRQIARARAGKFAYAFDPKAHVPTQAPTTWRQFWNQRVRFGSKGRHHGFVTTLGIVAVYLFNVFIVAGIVAWFAGEREFAPSALAGWIVKSLVEFGFLRTASKAFGERHLLRYFLPTAVIHPIYITLFGGAGLFGKFRWKE
jgi:biofilm PGA synthesis N-glycosyltransferase PgaC